MLFLLPSGLLILWSRLLMSNFVSEADGSWILHEFPPEFCSHFWPLKSKSFIYVLSFAIRFADLVKSAAHVKGNLKLFWISSGFLLSSNFCLILIEEVDEPILTKKSKGFIYVLSFAIRLADLVKSAAHVKGNLNEGCVSKIKKPLIVSMNHSFQSL